MPSLGLDHKALEFDEYYYCIQDTSEALSTHFSNRQMLSE